MMKNCFVVFLLFSLFSVAYGQKTKSLHLSQDSFRLEQTDALTNVNIDPIRKDPSNRKCARIKLGINRMTPDEIAKIQVKTVGGNVVLTKRVPMTHRGGLEIEMTARTATFYLYHPTLGESNTVTVSLEGDKVYLMDAWAEQSLPMTVFCARGGAEVYVDDVYRGKIDDADHTLTVTGIMAGMHKIKVQSGSDVTEQEVELTSDKVFFNVELKSTAHLQQFVIFRVDPANALLDLDGETIVVNDGIAQKLLKFGTYNYSIIAKDYYTHAGQVTVNSTSQPVEVKVTLVPSFGKIDISGISCDGSAVYIDNEYVGTSPVVSGKLTAGRHEVKLVKSLYKTHIQTVEINEGDVIKLTPSLIPNYGTVNITTPDVLAGIYINDAYKGKGTWKGRLDPGTYKVEARRDNHRPTAQYIEIADGENRKVTCPSPTPINGSLAISSTPPDADLYIDGVLVGKTPYYSSDILVGTHRVKIVAPDHRDWVDYVTVEESKPAELSPIMSKGYSSSSNTSSYDNLSSLWKDYDRGYSWSAGYNIGTTYDGNDIIFDIYTSHGYQFNPRFYLGAHLGLGLGSIILEEGPLVPIAALDLRTYFCDQVLYMGTRLGYPYIADLYMGVLMFNIGMEVLFSPSHWAFGFNVMF